MSSQTVNQAAVASYVPRKSVITSLAYLPSTWPARMQQYTENARGQVRFVLVDGAILLLPELRLGLRHVVGEC